MFEAHANVKKQKASQYKTCHCMTVYVLLELEL